METSRVVALEGQKGLDVEWGERRIEKRPLTAGMPLPPPRVGGDIGCKEED